MKILDRVVSALASLGVIVLAFFAPIVHWLYELPPWQLITGIIGGQPNDKGLTADDVSIYDILTLFKDFGIDIKTIFAGGEEPNPNLDIFVPLVKPVVIFFALTLVIALAAAIVSIVSNAKKTQMALGAAGIISLILLKSSFDKLVAPIVSGQVSVAGLFNISWLSMIVKIDTITLSGGWVYMIMMFAFLILWSLSYILTSDEKKQDKKKQRPIKSK
ncbi:MAG: hypothetical protein E7536_03495 [Ruminococcaceae bacterium]|nr:hypothetical protein [Oscillospiraceae bacterium]